MKSNNIITISVGIPAYNEEANIRNLIDSILQQKLSKSKKIVEIIVVSDGSNDNTIENIKSIRNKKIKIINGSRREGKNRRLNQIFSEFIGDVLILLDADVVLDGKNVINNIVNPFIAEKNLGFVAGNVQPLPAKTLPEKAFNNYVHSLNFIKSNLNRGNNIYSARGPILALSNTFAKKLHLPKDVPDDRYLYLTNIKYGYKFVYEKKAKVWFRPARLLSEQINQGIRYQTQKKNLESFFDIEIIKNEYHIPFYLKVIALFMQVFRNPFAYVTMKYIQLRTLFNRKKQLVGMWNIANSTKNLSI